MAGERYQAAKNRKPVYYDKVVSPTVVKYPNAKEEAQKLAAAARDLSRQVRHQEAVELFARAVSYDPSDVGIISFSAKT